MSQSPIVKTFRAAARLINENRDTIFYTALAGLTVATHSDKDGLREDAMLFLSGAFGRELVRSTLWHNTKDQMRIVTDIKVPFDAKKFFNAATCGCTTMFTAHDILHGSVFWASVSAATSVTFAYLAGGPRGVIDSYKVMWNWPKNRHNGGGTSQSQKVKDGFMKLASSLAGRRPAPTASKVLPQRGALQTNMPSSRKLAA